ncbi:MAG: Excinuclease subunit domain protein [Verrucomicrobiaceae bacterium]|nr:Excinuclease subunit domain protein [Verrucomicrobiaceae bacterium]MDB6117734.1 Excinuclease subunit domain protein [Verrucomicrobiaceae bacterium]
MVYSASDYMPSKLHPQTSKQWVLYVLRCNDETLYCGITNNLDRRIAQHSNGKGARYTKGRSPLKLLKSWPAGSMSAALKAELAFKKLTREAKEKKIRSRSRKDAISLLLAAIPTL